MAPPALLESALPDPLRRAPAPEGPMDPEHLAELLADILRAEARREGVEV